MSGRWDCWCGAKDLAVPACPWCGRHDPATFRGYHVPPPGPRVGFTPVTRLLTASLALLLVAGGVTVGRRLPDAAPSLVASPPSASPSPSPSVAVETVVERAKTFIAEFRGAPFTEDVEVLLLSGSAFTSLLNEDEDETDPDADITTDEEDFEATLHALQLADPDDDLEAEEDALRNSSVLGFYDTDRKRLVVRAGTLDAFAELTLVHELTHAWQDQHHDLDSLWEGVVTQDHALAVRALVEGDATRTENAWREAQPASVKREIDRREREEWESTGTAEDVPRVVRSLGALYGFPYDVGESFAQYVWDNGNNQALTSAFADPPTTTAQVLHPEKFLVEDGPSDVPDPVAGGRVLDRGTLGEAGLIVTVGRGDVGKDAVGAAEGWDGDEYVTWESGGRTCTTVSIVMDTERQRDALVAALRKRPLGRGGVVEARARTGVRLVSCEA